MHTLIDTHVHIEQFDDLEGVLKRADENGVKAIITCGVDLASNKAILEIKKRYTTPKIYVALGIHPGDVETPGIDESIKLIEDNIDNVVAVGECGLDYWYKEARKDGPGRDLQKETFRRQLEIAKKYNKPVVIHSRGAWKDCHNMVVETGNHDVLFHWYSGPIDILGSIILQGFYMSATPSAEYSKEHRAAIKEMPLERLVLETDSPVTYKPDSGKYTSEPKDVIRVVKAIAEIKGMNEEAVSETTTQNAITFFNLNL